MRRSPKAAGGRHIPMRSFGVVVNEVAVLRHPNPSAIRTRETPNGGPANFRVATDGLVRRLPRQLEPQEQDWLEILTALYAADLACQRARGDTDWYRDIELHVGVRDPSHWTPFVVPLQELFADLTYDRMRLHLHADPEPVPPAPWGRKPFTVDSVAMLSGGVDSFVGALELLAQGRTPLWLSHGSGAVTTPQSAVRGFLDARNACPSAHISIDPNQQAGFGHVEDSRRARSLLFMGIAALAASVVGVEDVFLNENGVMAVHVPSTEARAGSFSTKTASPPVVDAFVRLASAALDCRINVRNVLITRTKPEVVELGVRLTAASELAATASCWRWSRKRGHCGECAPCLMRRLSFEIHGVQDAPYAADPLRERAAFEKPTTRDNVTHLCWLVSDLVQLDDLELEFRYPEVLAGGTQISPADTLAMYRRWGVQADAALRAHPLSNALLTS
jgi:hypothetical protein